MTPQERLDIIVNKMDEGLVRLQATDVADPASHALAETILAIHALIWPLLHEEDYMATTGITVTPVEQAAPFSTTATLTPVEEPAPVEEPKEEPEAVEEPKEEPKKQLTIEEVRGILGPLARQKKADVGGLIKGWGYTNLSAVPPERYEELVEAAKALVQ